MKYIFDWNVKVGMWKPINHMLGNPNSPDNRLAGNPNSLVLNSADTNITVICIAQCLLSLAHSPRFVRACWQLGTWSKLAFPRKTERWRHDQVEPSHDSNRRIQWLFDMTTVVISFFDLCEQLSSLCPRDVKRQQRNARGVTGIIACHITSNVL